LLLNKPTVMETIVHCLTGWYTALPHTTLSRRMSTASSCFLPLSLVPDTAVEAVVGLLDADPGEFVSHTEVIRMSPAGSDVLTPVSRQA